MNILQNSCVPKMSLCGRPPDGKHATPTCSSPCGLPPCCLSGSKEKATEETFKAGEETIKAWEEASKTRKEFLLVKLDIKAIVLVFRNF